MTAQIDMANPEPSPEPPPRRADRDGPLQVRLHLSDEARDKLAEALKAPDARDKWLRIFPQGIS